MPSVKCNDSLRDTVTLTPKILERMFYNHILRIKGRKKEEEARGEGREEEEETSFPSISNQTWNFLCHFNV